ncbi:MAG: glycoside hydrolase family 92 protein [Lentimicrobiaceae bacterium]|nr:glycoside hydrolase family 92 protein [Lentimicrobiaceae bacterium]
MNRNLILIITMCILSFSCSTSNHERQDLAQYVKPFVGTGGHGHTYPGAVAPFGMIQNSPDTRMDSWDGCSGYHISDTTILGFSLTHLTGTGCNDYGDFRFSPITGEVSCESEDYSSSFKHENETAKAGYYSVILDDYNIKVELTAAERAAMQRYTFPQTDDAHLIIDLQESNTSAETIHESFITIESDNAISGFRRTGQWAKDQYLYFYAEFSEPFTGYGICSDNIKHPNLKHAEGKDLQAWLDFDVTDGQPIVMRVATSAVDVEGAKKNLASEITDFDFDALAQKTYQYWNDELNRININTVVNAEDKDIFYTSLYHCFIVPNLFSDVDGRYRAHDKKIYQSDRPRYTVFSLWDTFRTEHPLLTLVQRERSIDIINTFINNYETGGLLPVWELAANETNCMIGYHSMPVIADAYFCGLEGIDYEKALEAMVKSANEDQFGVGCYKEYGFIPSNCEGESVSKTLEYAYDDWCIARLAEALGKQDIADEFYQRAQYYKNLYDPSTKFFRGKRNGCFVTPFDPTQVNFMLTEANTWQYNFFAPQDINTHIEMMGGMKAYDRKLNELFNSSSEMTGRKQSDITGLIGQYAHGNEPSHHMAYLYNYLGKPSKTQRLVNKIMYELYTDQPDGLCGNEDCGQMSAWYVMSALGFYPVTPASGYYVIGVPHFEEMTINLKNGKTFTVVANNLSRENRYIESVKLNGKPLERSYIYFDEVHKGGKLEFTMTNNRKSEWATELENCPSQKIEGPIIVTTPVITVASDVFFETLNVELSHIDADAKIYYTLDGSTPDESSTLYTAPFDIKESTDVRVVAIKDGKRSNVIEGNFKKIAAGRTIKIENRYNSQYEAGGDIALIDYQRGSNNFRVGTWQGYHGVDLVATIDLSEVQDINRLAGSFLQDQKSWIFMPKEVEFFVSNDGKNFKSIGSVKNHISQEIEEPVLHEFSIDKKISTRYIKMVAKKIDACPDWHVGAGEPGWIFCDEIVIE